MEKKNINRGAAFLFIIFGLLFFVLFFRLFAIEYSGEADGQPLSAKAKKNIYNKKRYLPKKEAILTQMEMSSLRILHPIH